MKEMPPDLTIFLRDIGIVDDIGLQKENVSDTLKIPDYEVWLPKHEGEEIPF
jgi:hypothetical protein